MPYPGTSGLLGPIVALNAWTLAIEAWMYKTRLPAFGKIKFDNTTPRHEIDAQTPPDVRWKADNYNHLLEQPLQFYAVSLVLVAAGGGGGAADVTLAWAYVGARVAHSLVQCVSNHIMTRFSLFVASSGILAVMTGRAAMAVWR